MDGASVVSIVNTSLLIIAILISISLISIVIFECFRIYGFKVTNSENNVYIKRGFLSEAISSIQKDRIYGVGIHQSIPQRIYGYATINLFVMGDAAKNDSRDDTNRGEIVMHPCIRVEDIPVFLETFIPEYAQAHTLEPHLYLTRKAKGRKVRQVIYLYSIVLVLGYLAVDYMALYITDFFALIVLDTLVILTVFLIGVCVAVGLMWDIKQTSYVVSKGFLANRRVRLETSSQYFPRRSLEYAQCKQTIWQIRPQLCDFVSETVAISDIKIDELSLDEAMRIVEWVETGIYVQ